ncbi:MAG: RrF2 family transcriptional regulator [Phycisphaerae bacterium]
MPGKRISKETQYAIRAIFDLAGRGKDAIVSSSEVARNQHVPQRFLESILVRLRDDGLVESRRGAAGGYRLAVKPKNVTVGRVIRLFEGDLAPIDCRACGGQEHCDLEADCAFAPMWLRTRQIVAYLYDTTTFADLLEGDLPDPFGQA